MSSVCILSPWGISSLSLDFGYLTLRLAMLACFKICRSSHSLTYQGTCFPCALCALSLVWIAPLSSTPWSNPHYFQPEPLYFLIFYCFVDAFLSIIFPKDLFQYSFSTIPNVLNLTHSNSQAPRKYLTSLEQIAVLASLRYDQNSFRQQIHWILTFIHLIRLSFHWLGKNSSLTLSLSVVTLNFSLPLAHWELAFNNRHQFRVHMYRHWYHHPQPFDSSFFVENVSDCKCLYNWCFSVEKSFLGKSLLNFVMICASFTIEFALLAQKLDLRILQQIHFCSVFLLNPFRFGGFDLQ